MLNYPSVESENDDSKYALKLIRLNQLGVRYAWKNKIFFTITKDQ